MKIAVYVHAGLKKTHEVRQRLNIYTFPQQQNQIQGAKKKNKPTKISIKTAKSIGNVWNFAEQT